MEIDSLCAFLARLSAFAAGTLLFIRAAHWWNGMRRSAHVREHVGTGDVVQYVLNNGCASVRCLSSFLVRCNVLSRYLNTLVVWADDRGYQTSSRSIAECMLVVLGFILTAECILKFPLVTIAVSPIVVLMLLRGVVRRIEDHRRAAVHNDLPEVLQNMRACFLSGYSLRQTLQHIESDARGPLRQAFRQANYVFDRGGTSEDALRVLGSSSDVSGLSFVAAALSVRHRSGGSIANVLRSAEDSVRQEADHHRSLRAKTAQARLSAQVVTAVTISLVFLMIVTSEDFIGSFTRSSIGVIMLGLALLMQVGGVALVHRMLEVNVK